MEKEKKKKMKCSKPTFIYKSLPNTILYLNYKNLFQCQNYDHHHHWQNLSVKKNKNQKKKPKNRTAKSLKNIRIDYSDGH